MSRFRTETIGDCTLILGDAREAAEAFPADAAIVSDPPYGVPILTNTKLGKRGGAVKKDGRAWAPVVGNDRDFDPSPWLEFPEALLWGANHFAHRLPHNGRWLVWDKRCGVVPTRTQADCELAWCNAYGAARMIRFLWDGICQDEKTGPRSHPTEKPIAVMRWCLGFVKAETVVDPFMGSGTTGVACTQMGRRFVGVEIVPEYFETACRRIEAAYRQPRLFAEPIPKTVQPSLLDEPA